MYGGEVIIRNFNNEEWQSLLSDEPYRKTCVNRPLSEDFISMIRGKITKGQLEIDHAVSQIQHALQAGHKTITDARDEANRLVAPGVLSRGQIQARKGEFDNAIASFKEALKLDPNLDIEPEKETKRQYALTLVEHGESLAQDGNIQSAIKAYAEAQEMFPNLEISAPSWNTLCWFGALDGFAADVIDACKRAVDLEPDHGDIRDSRGVARALTGDYSGAIDDFRFFIQWARTLGTWPERILQREVWITKLQDNENPFTAELLQQLRDQ